MERMVKSVDLSDGYSKSEIESVVSEIFKDNSARENFRLSYNTDWMKIEGI